MLGDIAYLSGQQRWRLEFSEFSVAMTAGVMTLPALGLVAGAIRYVRCLVDAWPMVFAFVVLTVLSQIGCGLFSLVTGPYLWPPSAFVVNDPCCDSAIVLPVHIWVYDVNLALTPVTIVSMIAMPWVLGMSDDRERNASGSS